MTYKGGIDGWDGREGRAKGENDARTAGHAWQARKATHAWAATQDGA